MLLIETQMCAASPQHSGEKYLYGWNCELQTWSDSVSWKKMIFKSSNVTTCLTLTFVLLLLGSLFHDDVIKWKHFPRYWPFVRGIHRSPVNSPHKGQWRGALMFTLICARIKGWVNNRKAGDLRCFCTHCDVIVMYLHILLEIRTWTSNHIV